MYVCMYVWIKGYKKYGAEMLLESESAVKKL